MTSDDVRDLSERDEPVTDATAREGSGAAEQDPRPDAGMDTGSDEGSPGERAPMDPDDAVAVAVQDDAPLPPQVEDAQAGAGGPAGDGLDPAFSDS